MTGEHTKMVASSSWYEASARDRIAGLLDADSFTEFLGPEQREVSPHLHRFGLPTQFDDGMVVGKGLLQGRSVLIAAQEGKYMGGAIGEVHGAKLTGLLRAATALGQPTIILFESGGVRLQEANAGEVAISELMRAVIEARLASVPVIGLIGGRAGCFGGASLIAGCCSAMIISEEGRLSVSGPEVIENHRGVEGFDASDRPLIWRTMGGKHRYLIGAVSAFVDDNIAQFRLAAIDQLAASAKALDLHALTTTQTMLATRLKTWGDAPDARDVWRAMGVPATLDVPDLAFEDFMELSRQLKEVAHD